MIIVNDPFHSFRTSSSHSTYFRFNTMFPDRIRAIKLSINLPAPYARPTSQFNQLSFSLPSYNQCRILSNTIIGELSMCTAPGTFAVIYPLKMVLRRRSRKNVLIIKSDEKTRCSDCNTFHI